MWFDAWSDIVRVLLVGAAAYVFLITTLRVSGKRTLAKLNAFDLVVTVAVGSTLATILLSGDVSFAEGAAALALLAALQYLAAKLSRQSLGRSVLTARHSVLMANGKIDHDALRRERVSVDDVRQAVRSSGHGDLAGVAAVVLESDGSFSVIGVDKIGDGSALSAPDHRLKSTDSTAG
ncbi:hypothetical protein CRM90_23185 [Mycobacterium sp. ENV421]|uniref:DUF421 domain-containing protein n=1 Tax=Mycobacterium sp. ENV421 TaxID=1213407 RepID=UPI000C9AA046|nr:YetF domain-containing protein [Mycobacterium sp. ENV421]PND55378.1 hypothetical protein CRM90_23185 [Mycobacterium sp. ENV421]